ncbi:MAG: A/G-specific adenine glycosylase [Myxococcota bacterium]
MSFIIHNSQVASLVAAWFAKHARDLPWRARRTPYRVWLAEVMLQQTQVAVVKGYFARFVAAYPTVADLARASQDDVLALWAGLGFYSRGRNLHKAARMVVERFGGQFPRDVKDLMKLPGVGSYTAGAVAAFAYKEPAAVVDGNVARVLSRLLADGSCPTTPRGKRRFESVSLALAQHAHRPSAVQEGLIELGALVCKPRQPLCHACPLRRCCLAYAQGRVDQFPVAAPATKRTILPVACALVHTTKSLWLERRDGRGPFCHPECRGSDAKDPPTFSKPLESVVKNVTSEGLASGCHPRAGGDPDQMVGVEENNHSAQFRSSGLDSRLHGNDKKKRNLLTVNEHFEKIFNEAEANPGSPQSTAARARTLCGVGSAVVFNHALSRPFGGAGLFGGLYEPPSCQVPAGSTAEQVVRAVLAHRGIPVSRQTPLGPPVIVRRLLSHRELVLHGFPVRLEQEDPPGAHWVDRGRLERIGLSHAVRQLLRHGLPGHVCLERD